MLLVFEENISTKAQTLSKQIFGSVVMAAVSSKVKIIM
jgi:hypothetical protein